MSKVPGKKTSRLALRLKKYGGTKGNPTSQPSKPSKCYRRSKWTSDPSRTCGKRGPPQGMGGMKPEPFHAEVTFDWVQAQSGPRIANQSFGFPSYCIQKDVDLWWSCSSARFRSVLERCCGL